MTFDQYIGTENRDESEGRTRASILIQEHHKNPTGMINGGVIISLADNTATGAANIAYFQKTGKRAFLVGVDLHAVMLANQEGGEITATASPVRVGNRMTVIRTQVTGIDNRLLAEITTTHMPT